MRDARGLSARQVSSAAGLSPTYVSKVERGAMEPSLSAFSRLAMVLDLNDAEVAMVVRIHAANESDNEDQG